MVVNHEDAVPEIADMLLSELPRNVDADVVGVVALYANDAIADRLRDIGFTPGRPLRVVAYAPWGKDPMMVEIGATRFALRALEARRVSVAIRLHS